MTSSYTFGRISDTAVLALFEELAQILPATQFTLGIGDGIHSRFQSSAWQIPKEYEEVLSNKTFLIQSATLHHSETKFSIEYRRGQTWSLGNNSVTWVPSKNGFVEGLKHEQIAAFGNGLDILQVIARHVSMAPPDVFKDEGEGLLSQSGAILTRLTEAVAALVEHTSDRQKTLDLTRHELEQEARRTLDGEREKLRQQAKEEEEALAREREELEKRAVALDDRANTYARREAQKSLAGLVDTRLGKRLFGQSLGDFALTVGLAAALMVVALAGAAWEYGQINGLYSQVAEIRGQSAVLEVAGDSMPNESRQPASLAQQQVESLREQILFHQIRLAAISLVIGALGFTILRSSFNRYRQVNRWERDLHRHRLDIERATMLVEADLEARKLNDQGLPEILLQSFSRGLFTAGPDHQGADGSDDELGGTLHTLLGQAARVQLKTPAFNVDIDKPGLRRARRRMEAAAEAED